MPFEDELHCLRRAPTSVDQRGEVPELGGVYVWWCRRGAIPHLPDYRPRHAAVPDIDTLHVGVASGTSAATSLRQKIDGDLYRSIERSRFRLDLALLLKSTLSLQISKTKQGKPLLSPPDDEKLTQWQRDHLMFTWASTDETRAVAAAAIAMLHPPLNLPYKGWDLFWEPFLTATIRRL